jgi:hypothetical protein
MYELELGLNSSEAFLRFLAVRGLLDDFDSEIIIGVSLKTFITIRRYFALPICLCDRRTNIVRVKPAMGGHVVKLDGVTIFDELG